MSSPTTSSSSSSSLTRQPFKFLYTAFFLTTLPLRLIAIFLYYAPKFLRPNPRWSYHQAVGNKVFGIYWRFCTAVEFRNSKTLDPGPEKERFVVISPPTSTAGEPTPYQGIVNRDPAIRPSKIGGVWYASPPPPGETPKLVVIHFHGGAYVLGGARTMESGEGAGLLSKYLDCPVLLPQYRISTQENSSFPAALQDAITAYTYVLMTLGAENVVLSGDSAGGNLVIALIRYLQEEGKAAGLPLPKAGLLWGPWIDLTAEPAKVDNHPNYSTDYIFGSLVAWGYRRFIPSDLTSNHPYISPLNNEFHSVVPLFVQTGTAEILHEDHLRFVEAMREKGTRVELVEIKDAPHDTFAAAPIVGFSKENEDAVLKATNFVNSIK